jgi:hypothetical protein
MAQITWNNVAAPNLGESNSLFAQAIQSLKDAGLGLKDTAKDYQTVVRNRSHAILQDYINSAKSPEELQSEAFNTGFKNLQATLANEYDPVKVNDYRDTRGDVLTKRAGDAVDLARNQFGFAQEQLKAPTELDLLKTSLINAQTDADFKAKNNPLVLRTNTVAADVADATKGAVIKNTNLTPTVTEHGMTIQDRAAATAEKNAESERIRANADAIRKASGGDIPYAQTPNGLLDAGIKNIRGIQDNLRATSVGKSTYRDMGAVDAALIKEGGSNRQWTGTTSVAMDEIKNTLLARKDFVTLPDNVQAAIYADTISKMQNNNLLGSNDWYVSDGNRKDYATWANDAITAHTGYIQVAKEQEAIARQDLIKQLSRTQGVSEAKAAAWVDKNLGIPVNPNANAKPNAQTPLEAEKAGKIAGLQEKLKVKGLDLLTKASIQNQLKELGVR